MVIIQIRNIKFNIMLTGRQASLYYWFNKLSWGGLSLCTVNALSAGLISYFSVHHIKYTT